MKKKDFLLVGGGIILLVVIILIGIKAPPKTQVNIITDKKVYQIGSPLKVKIKNNDNKKICFSSCYPYYFEKKNEEWKGYQYENCSGSNLVERCIEPKEVRAFELVIPQLDKGIHRLAIPACIDCGLKEKFKEDKKFYSNDFIIK